MFVRSIVACAMFGGVAAAAAAATPVSYPDVTMDYKPMFDAACAQATGKEIAPAAVDELRSRLESFRESWRRDAPRLLGAVPEITGVPLRFREAKAALFLCGAFPAMSLPLMLNVRIYLEATAKGAPVPAEDFSNLVFHEVLHRYVGDIIDGNPGRTTPVLDKYRDEAVPVRNHLHLYALMAAVYNKLGREDELGRSFVVEQKFPKAGAISARAREIIAAEGADRFIRELRPAGEHAATGGQGR
jgi:hypothetical protein